MTRVATTDLFLNFAIETTSFPTTTQGTAVITALYKHAYTIMYKAGTYSDDDSTDTDNLIDIADTFVIIQAEASDLIDMWHYSGIDNPRPIIELSAAAIKRLRDIKLTKLPYIDNVRLWGSDYGDYSGIN